MNLPVSSRLLAPEHGDLALKQHHSFSLLELFTDRLFIAMKREVAVGVSSTSGVSAALTRRTDVRAGHEDDTQEQ